MVVACPCYVFGVAVELQLRISCYTERLQLRCNLPATSTTGIVSADQSCAKENDLRLVNVELYIVLQEPRPEQLESLPRPVVASLTFMATAAARYVISQLVIH